MSDSPPESPAAVPAKSSALSRLREFRTILPYCAASRRALLWGGVFVFLANFLEVRVLVLLGDAIDVLGWNLGPLAGPQRLVLRTLLLSLGAIAVAAGAARYAMRRLIVGASRDIEFALRNDLFAHLQSLSASFFSKTPTGDIMNRATGDIEAVRLVVGPSVMYLASTSVMLPLSLYAMLRISPALTFFTWSPLLLLAPLFYFFSSRIHERFAKTQETFGEIGSRVQETLTGIRVLKAYACEDAAAERFGELSERYVVENVKLARLQALFMPLMQLVVGLSVLALVGAGGAMIASGADVSQGKLISFFVLLMSNIWPLAALGWVFSLVERGTASMKRINAILDARPEVKEPDAPVGVGRAIEGRVEFRDLTFAYPGAAGPSLRDLSFVLEPGRTLGLTGPVGSGKSTVATLLARRYDPPRGTILVDGIDLLDRGLKEYRSRVAIVDQEPFLFGDTIRANVCLGLAEDDAGVAERAAEIAQLTGDVAGFPQGFDTLLGERGINMSGGQRQRTALARAVAADPAILVLDDALAAVDTQTEERILRGLREFMKGRTTILISHRVSTMSMADRILYLEDGRAVETGTHEELLARGGRYADLARIQRLEEEIEATA